METVIDYPRGITFEQVWASIKELRESQKETDRLMKEAAEQKRKSDEDFAIEWKKMTKLVGDIGNSVGGLIETLVASRLWEKFDTYNFKRAYRRVPVYDGNNKVLTEIDILLSDTDWVMAVEVKDEVRDRDIEHHINRMSRIKKYPPAEVKGKKLLGAIAGGIVQPDARSLAHEAGFFVLELKGESVELVPSPDGFSPREW